MASPMSLKLLLGAFVAIHMVVDRNKTKKMQTKYRHPLVKASTDTADSVKGIRNFVALMWTVVTGAIWWQLFPMQHKLMRNLMLFVGAFGSLNLIGRKVLKNNPTA